MKETNDLSEEQTTKSEIEMANSRRRTLKRYGIVGAIALISFLLGYLPAWLSARNFENERDEAVKTLRTSMLQNNLATATINARRGEFEQARQQASDFFTNLRAEIDRGEPAFSLQQRETVQPILAQRDEIITLLARNDAAAVDRLTDVYFVFLQAKSLAAASEQ